MSDSLYYLESVKQAALVRLAGAQPGTADDEMRWVIAEFLRESRVWQVRFTVTLEAGVIDYDLPLAEEFYSATLLMRAEYNGFPIGHVTPPIDSRTGAPSHVMLTSDRTLRIYPMPTAGEAGQTLLLDVVLTILPTIDAIPPDVIRPYHDALLDGLLARMYGMTDKPWTDVRMAGIRNGSFIGRCAQARRETELGRAFGSTYARPRRAFM